MKTQLRVLNALETSGLTARQIASRFSVGNPYDVIYRLRLEGHDIVLNEGVRDGRPAVKRRYELVSNRARARARA